MCGITGYAGIDANDALISSMVDIIDHRGPDDKGFVTFKNTSIGMTRLSIVDLIGGSQPMCSQNERYWIVFNGEIYNHKELLERFRSEIRPLRTKSDTEVILNLYETFGADCLQYLRGMFAFAILDKRENSLFIVRDRFGIKPLYFWTKGKRFVFGSEIKSILKSNQFSVSINKKALSSYLTLRYVPQPLCLINEVQKLEPGCWLKWQDGSLEQKRFWEPNYNPTDFGSERELQNEFDFRFEESVNIRQMGDVPFGAYLSGGLDSSAVVNAIRKQNSATLDTFTIGFGRGGDEFSQARETARALETNHHEISFCEEDFKQLPRMVWSADEPLGDPIVLPTYVLAREAKKHVKFVLTGEGADEVLGGYLFHKAVLCASAYKKFVPGLMHDYAVMPILRNLPASLLNMFFNYPGELGQSGKQRLLTFLNLTQSVDQKELLKFFICLFEKKEQKGLLSSDYMNQADDDFNDLWGEVGTRGNWFDNLSSIQFNNWLPDNILMRQDKLSMANGLEARVPFLDHELVEFLLSVPVRNKIDFFKNKKLLRNYINRSQVDFVSKRQKRAFYFPMEKYFGGKIISDLVERTLSPQAIQSRGILNEEYVRSLYDSAKNNNFLAAKQVFSLITLELWLQIFIDKSHATYSEG